MIEFLQHISTLPKGAMHIMNKLKLSMVSTCVFMAASFANQAFAAEQAAAPSPYQLQVTLHW